MESQICLHAARVILIANKRQDYLIVITNHYDKQRLTIYVTREID